MSTIEDRRDEAIAEDEATYPALVDSDVGDISGEALLPEHGPCRWCGEDAYGRDEAGWVHPCCDVHRSANCPACSVSRASNAAYERRRKSEPQDTDQTHLVPPAAVEVTEPACPGCGCTDGVPPGHLGPWWCMWCLTKKVAQRYPTSHAMELLYVDAPVDEASKNRHYSVKAKCSCGWEGAVYRYWGQANNCWMKHRVEANR